MKSRSVRALAALHDAAEWNGHRLVPQGLGQLVCVLCQQVRRLEDFGRDCPGDSRGLDALLLQDTFQGTPAQAR